jgi:hypothetical protein
VDGVERAAAGGGSGRLDAAEQRLAADRESRCDGEREHARLLH